MASQAQLCRMTPPSEGGSRYAAEPLYYQLCELRHATSTFHSFDPDDGYISNRSLQGFKPDAQSEVAWAERSDGVTPINVRSRLKLWLSNFPIHAPHPISLPYSFVIEAYSQATKGRVTNFR